RALPFLSLLVSIALLAGCGNRVAVRQLPDGRYVPKDWRTCPVEPNSSSAQGRLQFDALYVCAPYQLSFSPQWERSYYRFWPDGQVMEKGCRASDIDQAIPSANDADDFSERGKRGTLIGRYRIDGGDLSVAFLGVDESGWHWCVTHFNVNGDGS